MSYTVICILAHVMESSRIYYYQRLQAEVDALAEAKQQVKTLHTLLPICASCKKIRDDSGYWHQVKLHATPCRP
ncbi:MAG: hypothetical protein R2932_35945 [Caldilineaceae bacterium]